MDINSSHLVFFKAEANKYAILCTESFYGTDYCPLETEQTLLSKPHLQPQASIKPKGDCSPVKNTLLFPASKIYIFPVTQSSALPKSPRNTQAWAIQVDENIHQEKLKYSRMKTTYRNFFRNKTSLWWFQDQNYPFFALFLMLPGLKLWPFSVCRYHRKWNEERVAVKSSLNSPISLQQAMPWIRIYFIIFIVLHSDATLTQVPCKVMPGSRCSQILDKLAIKCIVWNSWPNSLPLYH